jgi:hypothetical protein
LNWVFFRIPPVAISGIALFSTGLTDVGALELRVYNPTAHLRMTGYPAAPQVNPAFLNPGGNPVTRLDLSGIGWSVQDPTKQLTLVSPRHFVGANHFRPGIGSTVRFLGTDNTLHTLTIASITALPNENGSASDLYLGEFTGEIPDTAAVLPLPYLNLATETAYAGQSIIVAGQAARGGKGVIGSVSDFGGDPITGGAGIQTRAFTFSYTSAAGSVDDAHAQGGDSGSPSVAIRSGRAALVGTHTAVLTALGTVTTYDTLVPHYAPGINALMEDTGLRLRKIDPPATSFSITGGATDPTVRMGEPLICRFTLTNTSSAEADNVNVRISSPPSLPPGQFVASGWRDNADGSLRRSGLTASGAASFDITFAAAPQLGTILISLLVKSDGSAPQSQDFPITILPSFAGWAQNLTAPGILDDGDADGITNLLEYACGGDPLSASVHLANTMEPLTPGIIGDPRMLTFIRRSDATERGLRYFLQRSTDLTPASWETLRHLTPTLLAQPATGFEKAAFDLPVDETRSTFYRLQIELDE